MAVTVLSSTHAEDAVTVLCDAFFDYPVMRYVLGNEPDYARRLRTLVGFFVAARVYRADLLLGVQDDRQTMIAAALVTLPGERPTPPALAARREAMWPELGGDARRRYEAYGAASHRFDVQTPHHYLNMIGVRRSHLGQGHGRALLEFVHRAAESDPGSSGVALSTELPRNVGLYEHFGYRLLGHVRIAADLETWTLYRPSDRSARSLPAK